MALATENAVDPITFEVVRNRLWSINDEQGTTAARISGSPAVYEAYDFNAAILDKDGACLFIGVYITMFGTSLTTTVRAVIERFGDDIHEGDMFITNDPWVGALHMNDLIVVAPVFHEGQRIAWTGITMHEMDVGGPIPGSFVVGATEVFGESPLITPLKLVAGGRMQQPVESLLLRNTRTAPLNALNLRARVSAQQIAHDRISAVVARYGLDTFDAVLDELKRQASAAFSRRLRSLPDGHWSERLYIDHDGNDDISYPILLTMSKRGDKLTFDFTGTAPQAPGLVNCTRSGMEGGVMSAVLPLLCYDLPWCPGGIEDAVEIVSEEGTVNNAQYPAAVSMATISGAWVTAVAANSCIAKMLASSPEHRSEVQAAWNPAWHGIVIAGLDQRGHPLTAVLMDGGGGGSGARADSDGIDAAGYLCAISAALPNVETNERLYPIVELYRRHGPDTGGAGRFRGGVGVDIAFVPHKNPIPLQAITFANGANYPSAPGIYGGQPSSLQRSVVLRETNIWSELGAGRMPQGGDGLTAAETVVLAPKDVTVLGADDVYLANMSGGGGFGDPLDRDVALVQRDVLQGMCSRATAEDTYGVAFRGDAPEIDVAESERRRDRLRQERLTAAGASAPEAASDGRVTERVGSDGQARCPRCGTGLGQTTEDIRTHAVVHERSLVDLSPRNVYGKADEFYALAFYCPGCGEQLSCEVLRRGEEMRAADRLT